MIASSLTGIGSTRTFLGEDWDDIVTVANVANDLDLQTIGQELYSLIAELYPICRSITGDGVRETLNRLQKHIPLTIHEIPSGTQVFDWTVPNEWNIRDAYVKTSKGARVIDFRSSNLHVVNYSAPVKRRMPRRELTEHLFTLPDHPDWIPYRTSYYRETWGFCLAHTTLLQLQEDEYEVCIDSSLQPGHLTYGELLLKGETADEILLSCHACHPSLCNDNLSGVALATVLAKHLSPLQLRYSYRFLFIPGTIGAITWLWANESSLANIKHGLVVACVGDSGNFTYKKTRRGNADIDRAAIQALTDAGSEFEILDFSPYGYDERQYCSPGFNLPVGSLTRTPHGRFPQYHTSADNLDLVRPQYLAEALGMYLSVLTILENNRTYLNQNQKCEPQLGKRGLYRTAGGGTHNPSEELALLWVLNLSDGCHSLLDISQRSGLTFPSIAAAAMALVQVGLLRYRPSSGELSDPKSEQLPSGHRRNT